MGHMEPGARVRLLRRWGRRAVGTCGLAALLVGCSPYHEVDDVSDLDANQRVVVADIVVESADVGDRVHGIYEGSNIVVDDKLPRDGDGHLQLNAYTGHEVSSSAFGAHGGIVPVGAGPGPLYVLGIRAASTSILWDTTTFIPILVRVPPAIGRCEYPGTIHLVPSGRPVLRDEFVARHDLLVRAVSGCDLQRNLGTALLQ